MKVAKSRRGISTSKSKAAPKNIDEYIATVPEPARGALTRVRQIILTAAPAATTETISYGMPAFKYKGSLLWFAAFAKHCSVFPTARVIEEFKNELQAFEVTKGCIHFTPQKPIPAALLKKMVKARVAQLEIKKRP